jgi:hypothetical protein
MKYVLLGFLFQFMVVASAGPVHAGVAEASTGAHRSASAPYDLSGLSDNELNWFVTFLEGNLVADGWQEITADIIRQVPEDERETSSRLLYELGNKIGREWCRDNGVRRIDTALLRKWGKILMATARQEPRQITQLIMNIRDEVESLLD